MKRIKKNLCCFLALCSVVTAFPSCSETNQSADPSKDKVANIAAVSSETTGISSNVVNLSTQIDEATVSYISIDAKEKLLLIGNDSGYPLSGNYQLTADIDLSDKTWTPIGYSESGITAFSGIFNGNGHKITGLNAGKEEPLSCVKDGFGLFAKVSGSVCNLMLENVYFDVFVSGGYQAVGGIAGYLEGGNIENCSVSGFIQDVNSRQSRVGGLIGAITASTNPYNILSCMSDVEIVAACSRVTGSNQAMSAAGIVGSTRGQKGYISDCVVLGKITAKSDGILGDVMSHYQSHFYTDSAEISNCYTACDIEYGYALPYRDDEAIEVDYITLTNGGMVSKLSDSWGIPDAGMVYLNELGKIATQNVDESDLMEFIQTEIEGMTVSNYTTEAEVENFLNKKLFTKGLTASVSFTKTIEATEWVPGSRAIDVSIVGDDYSCELQFKLKISVQPTMFYNFKSQEKADGSGVIAFRDTLKAQSYELYWGDENGLLSGYSALAKEVDMEKTGDRYTYKTPQSLLIPQGATHLWLVSEDALISSYSIPEKKRSQFEEMEYSFGALSDVHFGEGRAVDSFKMAMKDYAQQSASFVIVAGDLTKGGRETEWDTFGSTYNGLSTEEKLPLWVTTGNHDTIAWNLAKEGTSGNYVNTVTQAQSLAWLKENFSHYCNTEVPYGSEYTVSVPTSGDNVGFDYSMSVNGDLFLFMGIGAASTHNPNKNEDQKLSQDQLDWLDSELNQFYSTTNGGRAFLIFHYYTLEGGMYVTGTEWDSASSAKLHTILNKYPNVVYFNGHNHWSFDVDMNIYAGNYTSVHIPSLVTSFRNGEEGTTYGYEGYLVENYKNHIVIRGYNFLTDEYISHVNFVVSYNED